MGDPIGALTLGGNDAVGSLAVTGALAHRYSRNSGAGIDDIVRLETLFYVLVELLGELLIASRVDCEKFVRGLLLDDTAVKKFINTKLKEPKSKTLCAFLP